MMAYSFLVSQPLMYIIALKNVQQRMDAVTYIQLRRLLDSNFRKKFRYVVYATVVSNMLLLASAIISSNLFLSICAVFSFCCLLADLVIMQKGNMPINLIINTWTENKYPANWQQFRNKWLYFFKYRQLLDITGFAVLLAGACFS